MQAEKQGAAPARAARTMPAAGERLDARILAPSLDRSDGPTEGAHFAPGDRDDPLRAASIVAGSRPLTAPACTDARGVAALLGVSVRHVRSMRARGALPEPLSIGRRRVWRIAELSAWIADGMPPVERWQRGKGQR